MSGYYQCDENRIEPGSGFCIYLGLECSYVNKNDALWVHPALDIGASVSELWAIGCNDTVNLRSLGASGASFLCSNFFQLDGSMNWRDLASSFYVTHAVRKDNTIWTWGDDAGICWGALGNNSSAVPRYSTPIQVITGTNWLCVSGHAYTFAALKTDNTLFTWGYNGYLQLGDGSTVTARSSPVQVAGSACWTKVCVGCISVLGMRLDGSLWSWGLGNDGQLGNPSFGNACTPVQVCGMSSDVREIHAGTYSNYAIKNIRDREIANMRES